MFMLAAETRLYAPQLRHEISALPLRSPNTTSLQFGNTFVPAPRSVRGNRFSNCIITATFVPRYKIYLRNISTVNQGEPACNLLAILIWNSTGICAKALPNFSIPSSSAQFKTLEGGLKPRRCYRKPNFNISG